MHLPGTVKISRESAAGRMLTEPAPVRWLLTGVALLFLGFFLLVPLASVFAQALEKGAGVYFAALREPDALAAVRLTSRKALNEPNFLLTLRISMLMPILQLRVSSFKLKIKGFRTPAELET